VFSIVRQVGQAFRSLAGVFPSEMGASFQGLRSDRGHRE
jgi:hypothetical protein